MPPLTVFGERQPLHIHLETHSRATKGQKLFSTKQLILMYILYGPVLLMRSFTTAYEEGNERN